MRFVSASSALALGLASLLAACSSDLPATRVVPLTDENGNEVVGPDGQVVRVKEVKRSDGTWVNCDSRQGARALARNAQGALQYVGQGLMNRTCAFGQCHASGAVGDQRSGAPAEMDFDLQLAQLATDAETQQQALDVLSIHQRAVYDWRGRIWTQVDKGHMPPSGNGEPFRGPTGLTFVDLDDTGVCTDGAEVAPITESETRWQLGAWLACGSPVVEASDPSITQSEPGQVGRRLPFCGEDVPDDEVTFEDMYAILETECATCHQPGGTWPAWDVSTPEVAYDSLVDAPLPSNSCGTPITTMVVPGDPDNSYILHKMVDMALASPMYCGTPMPSGSPYSAMGVEVIRAWIDNGAPGPGESTGGGDGGGGADAGI